MDHHPALPLPPFHQHHPDHHLLDQATASSGTFAGTGSNSTSACKNTSSFLCRQTSTRWIPTPDQIRILKDLYYNGGVRSPSAEEIQRISARLRQYGKIEGKNVFYWFQNHKARERQKRRLTVDVGGGAGCHPAKLMPSGMLSPTSPPGAGVYSLGHMGASGCGGSMLMERGSSFRDMDGGGIGWVGLPGAVPKYYYHPPQQQQQRVYYYDYDSPYNYYAAGSLSSSAHKKDQLEDATAGPAGLETLPLFPTSCCLKEEHHGEGNNHRDQYPGSGSSVWDDVVGTNTRGYGNYQHHQLSGLYEGSAAAAASLELTLNSYFAPSGSSI